MRVIFTHDVADDTCGFLERLIRCDAHLPPSIDDTTLNRLPSVSCIRNGTACQSRDCIVKEGILDFRSEFIIGNTGNNAFLKSGDSPILFLFFGRKVFFVVFFSHCLFLL